MKKALSILLLVVLLAIPSVSLAVTVNSISFIENLNSSAYDIRGVINDGTNISTTYNNNGYQVYLMVNGNEEEEVPVRHYTRGETVTNDGVELVITTTPTDDSKKINIVYTLKNTSSEEKQYKLATTSDVELSDNDCAAMYKDSTSIMLITQDDDYYEDDYGTQIRIAFSPAATTTWIGYYGNRYENRYVNGQVTSYTCDDYEDTGLAFSWSGTLAAGEEITYSAGCTITIAETGSVYFYKDEETTPVETLEGLVGGTVFTPAIEEETELGYKYFWNTQEDGSGEDYEAGRGIILPEGEMNLYAVKKSLWHDVTVSLSDGMNVDDEEVLNEESEIALEFLLEKGILKLERTEDTVLIYNQDDKLLFTITEEGILTFGEDVSYKDNIEYTLTDEDKEFLAEYDFFVNKITVSFGNAPEPFEYKILEGANQTHEIGDGKDLVVKTNGEVAKFTELKVDNNTVSADNYTIVEGSTIATLKTAYLDTLTEGEHTLTFVYNDGEVSTNFTVKAVVAEENVAQDTTPSNNPPTGDTIYIWFGLMIVSVLGIVVTAIIKFKRK